MADNRLEIICTECCADTLIVRTAKYDGFTRTGDTFKCASCAHEYASEDEVPFKSSGPKKAIFTDSDRSAAVDVFRDDEREVTCRYCEHYVVNPFIQKCALHMKIVEATDSCPEFERKQEPESDEDESGETAGEE